MGKKKLSSKPLSSLFSLRTVFDLGPVNWATCCFPRDNPLASCARACTGGPQVVMVPEARRRVKPAAETQTKDTRPSENSRGGNPLRLAGCSVATSLSSNGAYIMAVDWPPVYFVWGVAMPSRVWRLSAEILLRFESLSMGASPMWRRRDTGGRAGDGCPCLQPDCHSFSRVEGFKAHLEFVLGTMQPFGRYYMYHPWHSSAQFPHSWQWLLGTARIRNTSGSIKLCRHGWWRWTVRSLVVRRVPPPNADWVAGDQTVGWDWIAGVQGAGALFLSRHHQDH